MTCTTVEVPVAVVVSAWLEFSLLLVDDDSPDTKELASEITESVFRRPEFVLEKAGPVVESPELMFERTDPALVTIVFLAEVRELASETGDAAIEFCGILLCVTAEVGETD